MREVMFLNSELREPGWYHYTEDHDIIGPFISREEAEEAFQWYCRDVLGQEPQSN